jgi:repressor of nif and glnA expression
MPPITDTMLPPDRLDESDELVSSGIVSPPTPEALQELLAQHGERYQPILAALRDQPWKELVTSRELLEILSSQGLEWSERTLRLYLAEMSESGLIERHGRRGYRLAPAGAEVARELTVSKRLGSILYHMEETVCRVGGEGGFDLTRGTGLVSINAYVIPVGVIAPLIDDLDAVFTAGLAVGSRILFAAPGEDILGREVPAGCIGLGTMCSLTLAGMLLRRGVPTHPIFGGLLQMQGGQPAHFLEMIRYDATSLSPNEVFIRANFTSVSCTARGGNGAITASFREVPMGVLANLNAVRDDCRRAGFQGFLHVGRPGQPVLNIPVHEGRVGLILATGLNPLASLWERDHRVLHLEGSRPMVGPAPYEQLITIGEFRKRLADLTRGSDTSTLTRAAAT